MNMGHGEEVSEQLSPATMDCLPDDLLVQILTFLPMKQAVSTSVLSKRWRTLFALTHILGFDELFFSYYQQNQWKRREIQKKFRDFAYRTLALQRGSHINKLFLDLDTYINGGVVVVVKHWICYALKHGVSMLYLRITPGCLPSKVFTSTTLVKLSLGRRFIIDSFPLDTSLPALKVLFLDTIWFKGDQFSNVFLAACPALEDLTIQYYKYYPEYAVPISSKTIKKLSVTRDCDYYDSFSRIISFDTPNVVDFYYSDYCEHESPQCHLDSVGKATLDLYHGHTNDQDATDVTNLIRGIRNVKTLHLTSSTVEVISVCCKGGLPVFTNLIDLVFSSDKRRGWRVFLPLLLEHSPNLKTLVLSGLHRYTIKRRHRFVGIQIPLNNQIKMLRIMQYQGSAHELKHISHFLLKMECLEVLKVYISPTMDDTKQMQLTKDILKLPKASSNLKIQVMYSLLSSMGFQLKTNWQ